jgi:hypothetical protein
MPTFRTVEFCEQKVRIYMYWTSEEPLFEACPHALRGWQLPGYFEKKIPPDQNQNLLVLAEEANKVLSFFDERLANKGKTWGYWSAGKVTFSVPFQVWEREGCLAFFVYKLELDDKLMKCQLVEFWDTYSYQKWQRYYSFWKEEADQQLKLNSPGYFRPEI